MRKAKSLLLVALSVGLLSACSGNNSSDSSSSSGSASSSSGDTSSSGGSSSKTEESSTSGETIKIGVLVADASGEEALGFRNYFQNYIATQYNVEFVYSEALNDDATTKSTAERFIGQNCKAILDMADHGRTTIAELCEENQVYFAIPSGMLGDEDYESIKDNKYFVGQIGPSMTTEYESGLAMGTYFKNTYSVDNVGIYGAFCPNPMHLYRLAGLLTGLGNTYDGVSGQDIVTSVFAGGATVDATKIAGDTTVHYFQGYGDTTMDEFNTVVANEIDAFLSVGMATTFFADLLDGYEIPYSDIDSFTSSNGTHMKEGSLKYLAGKYSSSIGPIFAAVYNAINGNSIRDDSGYAISLSQGYWVATSGDEFDLYQNADSVTNPIFNKTLLDTVIGDSITYSDFKTFVEADRTPTN